jgi:hypothetical protein
MHVNFAAFPLTNLILSVFAADTVWRIGDVVQTSSGPVKGHASKDVPSVSEYLGINYAQPPVGNLRWALPIPFEGSRMIDADKFGAWVLSCHFVGRLKAHGITVTVL